MNLNLFEKLKKDINSNTNVENFIDELTNFLKDINLSQTQNKDNDPINKKDSKIDSNENFLNNSTTLDEENKNLQNHRKEGHLYLVTEDRNGEIYLWDFTDKPKYEFKETISSEELLSIAKEGAMLQYKNGEYVLYSPNGYDMLFDEENM